jgi:hypothetical protein
MRSRTTAACISTQTDGAKHAAAAAGQEQAARVVEFSFALQHKLGAINLREAPAMPRALGSYALIKLLDDLKCPQPGRFNQVVGVLKHVTEMNSTAHDQVYHLGFNAGESR